MANHRFARGDHHDRRRGGHHRRFAASLAGEFPRPRHCETLGDSNAHQRLPNGFFGSGHNGGHERWIALFLLDYFCLYSSLEGEGRHEWNERRGGVTARL